jgi:hypothetical protein
MRQLIYRIVFQQLEYRVTVLSESRFLEKGFLVLSYYSLRDASFALLVLL